LKNVSTAYSDKDDALHYYETPAYFEWWYNDVHFDNGYSCVIVYHRPCGFLYPRLNLITKEIYTPDGEKIVSSSIFRRRDCSASESKCDVKLGENYLKQEGDSYRVFAPGDDMAIDLVFKRVIPGWKPAGTGYLYNSHEQIQGWVVPVPRAEVQGTVKVNGKEMNVKGHGYHDHNWSNVNMHDSFRKWYWGRIHHPEYTLIYYYLYPARRNEPNISGFFLARGDKVLMLSDKMELKASNAKVDDITGISVPRNLSIRVAGKTASIKLEVITRSIFDSNILLQMAPWPVHYWRFKADYLCEIKTGGQIEKLQGQTMSEQVLLR